MASNNNRAYVDDNGRILREEPYHQQQHPQHPIVEWEDEDIDEDDPEFSTYFSDQKVEIPSSPDDDKVTLSLSIIERQLLTRQTTIILMRIMLNFRSTLLLFYFKIVIFSRRFFIVNHQLSYIMVI